MKTETTILEADFKITGMSCSGCERTLGNILKDKKGIIEVKASAGENYAKIKFDPELISKEEIKEIINTETIYRAE